LAEQAINQAAQAGTWVLLKNIHLAPAWLLALEKRLHALTPHANFRLFLTTEIHPKLPPSLLRTSTVFVFEPPPGVKVCTRASMSHLHSQCARARA
jgi:dynein heavy chain 1